MLLVPIPEVVASELARVGARNRVRVARHPTLQVGFLLGRKEEIAVSLDGQVLALCIVESTIGTTLTVEGVKVLDIELRVGKRARKVRSVIVAEKLPVAKVKLERTLELDSQGN